MVLYKDLMLKTNPNPITKANSKSDNSISSSACFLGASTVSL